MKDRFNPDLIQMGKKIDELKWISVKDRLPKDGQLIVAFYSPLKLCATCTYEAPEKNKDPRSGIWRDVVMADDPYWYQQVVTHWMPLPQPPKVNKWFGMKAEVKADGLCYFEDGTIVDPSQPIETPLPLEKNE